MSDLSWLNPTPHAIAVYASRPLSPVAAQHSLPSGRYSLLGPDFHRLDRTSLRLAHSFNHLVGAEHETGRAWPPKLSPHRWLAQFPHSRLTRWIENSNPRARAASSSGRSCDAVV